ncbi:bifunctional oligoribonuclease/PAP phosphatase NrnA [Halobacteria archaeon AArc-m2/3/4]|uniref:Bifunctional oligoribonuclease/PAP phosphatase NrnA n=1 Tax=Natronoglomus mannanivorans TaxID=2979990 RepID=A0AAP2YZS8_9EURY|nr:bifunctional oligoribonuclease/PAP phosphatase NrnA [Halobacteria archaeon AArc-xg1-1]MCU4975895.1 bifunctional oligoribonuclease/PAP phosphatase NrnA [Halobacteria archaeon AArc-m2/3/4]
MSDLQSRPEQLCSLLEQTESLLIVCHDNPDPDSIASALGLRRLATYADVDQVTVTYGGEISHQQNRAMVNTLDIGITHFEDVSLDTFDRIAFVDHSVPNRNNPIPPETSLDIVLDHHSVNDVAATYTDHRPEVGATATLVSRYLAELPVEPKERLATALLFAIHRETLGFTRGTTPAEHEMAGYLHPMADHETIQLLLDSVFTPETLTGIGEAILNREVRGSCLVSTVGRTTERDTLPQAADYLLKLEGVSTTVVFGLIGDVVHISARTRNSQLDIGALMNETFDDIGSAGGHSDMAGGQIPLGLFASDSTHIDAVEEITIEAVRSRVFSALDKWADE